MQKDSLCVYVRPIFPKNRNTISLLVFSPSHWCLCTVFSSLKHAFKSLLQIWVLSKRSIFQRNIKWCNVYKSNIIVIGSPFWLYIFSSQRLLCLIPTYRKIKMNPSLNNCWVIFMRDIIFQFLVNQILRYSWFKRMPCLYRPKFCLLPPQSSWSRTGSSATRSTSAPSIRSHSPF